MANHAAIQQQHGDLEPVLPRQLRVGIDVEDGDGENAPRALEFGQFLEHLIAEMAALAAEHHEARGQ